MSFSQLEFTGFSGQVLEIPQCRLISITTGEVRGRNVETVRAVMRALHYPAECRVERPGIDELFFTIRQLLTVTLATPFWTREQLRAV